MENKKYVCLLIACANLAGKTRDKAPNLNNDPTLHIVKKTLLKKAGERTLTGTDEEIPDRQAAVLKGHCLRESMQNLSKLWLFGTEFPKTFDN